MSSKSKIAATKEGSTLELVPRLRFPEFRETNAWRLASLGRLFSERQEVGFANLPLLSLMDKEGIVPQENTKRKNNSSADKSKYLRVVPGDIAYNTMRMWEGRSAYVGIEGLISPAYTVCVPAVKINSIFFSYYFKTEALIGQFRRYSQGLVNDTLNLKYKAFSRIQTAYPENEEEQQKIADCLTSLDDLIVAQTQKVDALKAHKRGLMQQLFPREGETAPRLRFPEFREAGEWTNIPMGNLLTKSPDYGVNAAAVPFSENLPQYLRITDISEDGRYLPDKKVSVDINATDDNYLDEGDIVLARTGASVGKSYRYRKEDGKLVFAGFLIRVKPKPTNLNSIYLANFLTTNSFWKWVAVTSARSGQPGINSTEYCSLPIPLPPDLFEQQRIADCLTSFDDLITTETHKLVAFKTHKAGLMQQLFPSCDEIRA